MGPDPGNVGNGNTCLKLVFPKTSWSNQFLPCQHLLTNSNSKSCQLKLAQRSSFHANAAWGLFVLGLDAPCFRMARAAMLSSVMGYQRAPLHCRTCRISCLNCHWHQMTFSCLCRPMLKRLDLSGISIKPGNPSELAFHSLITFARCCLFLSNLALRITGEHIPDLSTVPWYSHQIFSLIRLLRDDHHGGLSDLTDKETNEKEDVSNFL
jgi:hypothetical protein